MYLIAGLGNPGSKYEGTRHNMGFDVIDRLVETHHIPGNGTKFHAMYGKGLIEGEPVVLIKPLSYMNASGGPVRAMTDYFKIDVASELIVIYDDIDLPVGQLRIRRQGSAGGHNGMKDLIQKLGTQSFIRIKIGVGARPDDWDLAHYVLSRFSSDDRKIIDQAIIRASQAVSLIISDGVDAAMNTYNHKET